MLTYIFFSDFLNPQFVGQPIELKSLSPNNSFHQFEVVGEYNLYDGTLSVPSSGSDPLLTPQEIKTETTTGNCDITKLNLFSNMLQWANF